MGTRGKRTRGIGERGSLSLFPFVLSLLSPSLRFAPVTQATLEEVTTHEDVLRASSSGGISDEFLRRSACEAN